MLVAGWQLNPPTYLKEMKICEQKFFLVIVKNQAQSMLVVGRQLNPHTFGGCPPPIHLPHHQFTTYHPSDFNPLKGSIHWKASPTISCEIVSSVNAWNAIQSIREYLSFDGLYTRTRQSCTNICPAQMKNPNDENQGKLEILKIISSASNFDNRVWILLTIVFSTQYWSKRIIFPSYLLCSQFVENVAQEVQQEFNLKRKESKKAMKLSGSEPARRGCRKICPAKGRDFPQEQRKNCHPVDDDILPRRPILRTYNTDPDIVVLLVSDCLLHEAAVEHINLEQVVLKGPLRHIIEGSCCLLHKVILNSGMFL